MNEISQCVIPAAGVGTRFLPATKAFPKELLPVLDRPVIQWGVEEALAAGLSEMVIVLSHGKEAIKQHFDHLPELEEFLRSKGKDELLATVQQIHKMAKFDYVYQEQQLGLGHAVLCAEPIVKGNPFACMLPDDMSYGAKPVLAQLVEAYKELQTPIICLMRVPKEVISRYGCATVAESRGRWHRITAMVEKPKMEEAASDLAIMGRYVLTPNIFDALRATKPGAIGEIQLTDGIAKLLEAGEVWGVEFEGELLDAGTPQGWLETMMRMAGITQGASI